MLVTFVVIISAVLHSEVSSPDECQLGCNGLSYPPAHCLLLYDDILFRNIQRFSSALGTDDINCTLHYKLSWKIFVPESVCLLSQLTRFVPTKQLVNR